MSASTVGTPTHRNFGAGVTITITLPTGIALNDVIFIYLGTNVAGGTISATGYTNYHDGGAAYGLTSSLLYKVAAGTEGGTIVTVNHSSGSVDGAVISTVIRGLDITTPILGVSADVNASSTSVATGTVTWTGATDAVSLLAFTWQGGSTTAGLPSGFDITTNGATDNDTFEYADLSLNPTTVSSTSSLTSKTVTWASAPYGALNQYALKVASAPQVTSGPGSVGQFETSLRAEGWF